MIPTEVLVPAVVSLIVGVFAHIASLYISRSNNKNKLEIRNIESLEKQLEEKNKELNAKDKVIFDQQQSMDDLRDLKYQQEAQLERVKREISNLQDEKSLLQKENITLKETVLQHNTEIAALKRQLAAVQASIESD